MHADFMMTGGCGIAEECSNYLTNKCKHCKKVKYFNGRLSLNRTHHFYNKLEKAIKGFNKEQLTVTCVSPWLTNRYKDSPLYKEYKVVPILNPISDIFFSNYGSNPYNGNKNILFVTPDIYDPLKGGKYIELLAKRLPQYSFTIINAKDQEYKSNLNNKNTDVINRLYYQGIKLKKERELISLSITSYFLGHQ